MQKKDEVAPFFLIGYRCVSTSTSHSYIPNIMKLLLLIFAFFAFFVSNCIYKNNEIVPFLLIFAQ